MARPPSEKSRPQDAYVQVAKESDFASTPVIVVPGEGIDRVDICVVKSNGRYYALSNICTHKGGPMNQGEVTERNIICPWHKAYFRLEGGKNFFPAERALRSFDVKVQDGSVYLKPRGEAGIGREKSEPSDQRGSGPIV